MSRRPHLGGLMGVYMRRLFLVALTSFCFATFLAGPVGSAQSASRVEALFDLGSLSTSPFPTDFFTVPDDTILSALSTATREISGARRPRCRTRFGSVQSEAEIFSV